MSRALSRRQRAIVAFIAAYAERKGYPPTVREIGAGVGLSSTSSVLYQLNILETFGVLRRDRHIDRGLVLVPAGRRVPS